MKAALLRLQVSAAAGAFIKHPQNVWFYYVKLHYTNALGMAAGYHVARTARPLQMQRKRPKNQKN